MPAVSKPSWLRALTSLVTILALMRVSGAPFQPHWAELAAGAPARQLLARCLAACCLPELAAALLQCSDGQQAAEVAGTLLELGRLLTHPILAEDVGASLQQPPATALLQHAAAAWQALASV